MYNDTIMLYILFGLPGVGKTYVGKVFEKYFSYHFYDGDTDMSEEMRQAVQRQTVFTNKMRDEFFSRFLESTKALKNAHQNLVISQAFIFEKYRELFLNEFPEAKFILIKANDQTREDRLSERKEFPINKNYARQMIANFETPTIPHAVIDNAVNGEDAIKKQIETILS